MTIQAYIDETGLDGRGPVLVFSALYATVEDWAAFSDRWRAILDESPRIAYFKMDDATGFSGPFYGWSESSRNLKLMRLARTFDDRKYGFIETFVSADLQAIEEGLRPRAIKPANEPYFWPFQIIIQWVCASMLDTAPDYDIPMEMFFDENVIFGTRAKAWYPVIREMADPKVRALMPVEPLFRDDMTTMPLQAADMTAWMQRADTVGVNDFAWLREHLGGIHRVKGAEFGKAEIDAFFDPDPLPADQQWRADAARRAINEVFIKGRAKHYIPKPSTWTDLQKNPKKKR